MTISNFAQALATFVLKVLIETMNNPLSVSPSKGNQGTTRGVLSVCCFLITNIIFIFIQVFFRECRSFTYRNLYVFLEALLCCVFYFNLVECIERRSSN